MKVRWVLPVGSSTPRSLPGRSRDPQWPAYVSRGPLTDRGLTIVVLHSRAEADRRGYSWVGREQEWEDG